jgi:hypothetical protein
MKTWTIPVAAAQQFAANDYVSACTTTIKCDLDLNGYYRYFLEFEEPFYARPDKASYTMNYRPCGEVHEVDSHGELFEITITKARETSSTSPLVELPEPIHCYFFAEYGEDGLFVDGHCTLSEDGIQSNMS